MGCPTWHSLVRVCIRTVLSHSCVPIQVRSVLLRVLLVGFVSDIVLLFLSYLAILYSSSCFALFVLVFEFFAVQVTI